MINFEVPEMPEIMGGNSGFEFLPVQFVTSVPPAFDGVITEEITTESGYSFHSGYATPGTLSYTETPEETRAGIVFKISVKGFYPKASSAMVSLFAEMVTQKYILIVTDISGEKMIFGNKNEPLSFNFSKSSKSAPGERSGYDFEFSGTVTQASPVYDPVE